MICVKISKSSEEEPSPSEDELIQNIVVSCLEKCLEALDMRHYLTKELEISLSFVSKKEIKNLNSKFRNHNEETDVLSFPIYKKDEIHNIKEKLIILGDIIISMHNLRENSIYFKVELKEEFCRVIIHSLLHILGMEHQSTEISDKMIFLQEEILKEFKKDNHDIWGLLCL